VNRREELDLTVQSLLCQTYLASEILLSVPDASHVLPQTAKRNSVRVVISPKGLTAQRNKGIDAISSGCDIVVFLDDDMEFCESYIAEIVKVFESDPTIAMANGSLLRNGGIDRRAAMTLCQQHEQARECSAFSSATMSRIPTAYGCNMAAAWRVVRELRFDERLPLYGWLEDRDYSHRARQFGQIVHSPYACAVHLAVRSGRVSEVKYGYSQVINPFYLWKKNRACSLGEVVLRHWMKQIIANVVGNILRDKNVDRVGRLKGNLIGARALLAGRCEPERVLAIKD
jgi:GT2 family glycosyltransferase